MNTPTVVKCGCCSADTRSDTMKHDDDLQEWVCTDCAKDLRNAQSALDEAKIPPIHRGPYSGNSVG